jgi:hypothetical protein
MAEAHQLPDCFVLVRIGQLAAMVVRYVNVAREAKVCAVEVREPCGKMPDTAPLSCAISASSALTKPWPLAATYP